MFHNEVAPDAELLGRRPRRVADGSGGKKDLFGYGRRQNNVQAITGNDGRCCKKPPGKPCRRLEAVKNFPNCGQTGCFCSLSPDILRTVIAREMREKLHEIPANPSAWRRVGRKFRFWHERRKICVRNGTYPSAITSCWRGCHRVNPRLPRRGQSAARWILEVHVRGDEIMVEPAAEQLFY